MKKVLICVHPKWCELIFNGQKTIEVRRSFPRQLETPFDVLVYCTKGKSFLYKNPNNGELFLDSNGGYRGGDYEDRFLTGKVIGSFVCDKIDEYEANERGWYIYPQDETCLLCDEIAHYGKGKPLYGWHISDLKIYDKPRELSEFGIARPPQSWCYGIQPNEANRHIAEAVS